MTDIFPDSGWRYPAMSFMSVVFPPPEAQTSAVFFPWERVREKFSNTFVSL